VRVIVKSVGVAETFETEHWEFWRLGAKAVRASL
jgi:hypothetical protein